MLSLLALLVQQYKYCSVGGPAPPESSKSKPPPPPPLPPFSACADTCLRNFMPHTSNGRWTRVRAISSSDGVRTCHGAVCVSICTCVLVKQQTSTWTRAPAISSSDCVRTSHTCTSPLRCAVTKNKKNSAFYVSICTLVLLKQVNSAAAIECARATHAPRHFCAQSLAVPFASVFVHLYH